MLTDETGLFRHLVSFSVKEFYQRYIMYRTPYMLESDNRLVF